MILTRIRMALSSVRRCSLDGASSSSTRVDEPKPVGERGGAHVLGAAPDRALGLLERRDIPEEEAEPAGRVLVIERTQGPADPEAPLEIVSRCAGPIGRSRETNRAGRRTLRQAAVAPKKPDR
jgi:hypothetical protein